MPYMHTPLPNPGYFRPIPRRVMRTRSESLVELSKPCGRFRSTLDARERLSTSATAFLSRLTGGGTAREETGIPHNWQRLIAHLHSAGIIAENGVRFVSELPQWPHIPGFSISIDRIKRPTDGYTPGTNSGFGSDFDGETALSKAIGETLERYFFSTYSLQGGPCDSFAKLKNQKRHAFDVTAYNLFSPEQKKAFPELMQAADSRFYWSEAESLLTGSRILIPSQLVYWNYRRTHNEFTEPLIAPSTTSGCAGHFSRDEAILSALLELIQRDAFLIYWLNKISPARILIENVNHSHLQSFAAYVQSFGISLTFLDVRSDIPVPSVVCVASYTPEGKDTVYSMGAGTGFDLADALIKSIIEAVLVNAHAASLPNIGFTDAYKPFSDTTIGRNQRLGMWKGPHAKHKLDFFLSGDVRHIEDIPNTSLGNATTKVQLAFLLQEFGARGAGYEPLITEVHDPLLHEIGFHVVRALVPALVPLYLAEHRAPLQSARLKKVPATIGHAAAQTFNPWPHPFP